MSSCAPHTLQGNEVLHQPHLVPVRSPCGTAINTSILYHLLHAAWDAVPWVRSCPLLLSVFHLKELQNMFPKSRGRNMAIHLAVKQTNFFFSW